MAIDWQNNWWALIFIAVGTLWLLDELGIVDFFSWSLVAPLAIIALGIGMLMRRAPSTQ